MPEVAGPNEDQSRTVRGLAKDLLLQVPVTDKSVARFTGNSAFTSSMRLESKYLSKSSLMGSMFFFRCQKPLLSNVHFSVDVCEMGRRMSAG